MTPSLPVWIAPLDDGAYLCTRCDLPLADLRHARSHVSLHGYPAASSATVTEYALDMLAYEIGTGTEMFQSTTKGRSVLNQIIQALCNSYLLIKMGELPGQHGDPGIDIAARIARGHESAEQYYKIILPGHLKGDE
jgi:hypothetical protein